MSEDVKKLKAQDIKGLALDIDETLSFTISYWLQILTQKFGNPENLTEKEIISKYRYAQNVPYWQTEEALAWMEKARKSNEIQEILPLIEDSQKTVNKIHKVVPIVAYLTIRPESIIPGTKKWLNRHGFPDVPVIAKPDKMSIEDGSKWKAEMLKFLYPQVIGIIDDNPSIIDYLGDDYKGYIFLYDNLDHIKKSKNIIPCKTWRDVFINIKDSLG